MADQSDRDGSGAAETATVGALVGALTTPVPIAATPKPSVRRVLQPRRAANMTVDALIDVIAEFGGAVGDAVDKDYNFANPRAQKFLRDYMSKRVGMINATTRKAVVKALKEPDPRAAVREVFRQARRERAPVIADTEVVRASNWAVIDAGKWVKVLDHKRWATQQDRKVRHEHRGLGGQTVAWNDKFRSPGGYTGPGPGMMTGGAPMNVGCRCSAVPTRKDVEVELDGDPVAVFDGLRAPLAEEMARAWRRVFREQEKAVLAGL